MVSWNLRKNETPYSMFTAETLVTATSTIPKYTADTMTMDGTAITDDVTTTITATNTNIYDDTYSMFIHPHWRHFPKVADGWHYFIGVFITCVELTSIIGNALVIWVFSRDKSLRTSSNMLIINLAISDFTFSMNGFSLLSVSAFNKKWIFGQRACEFYGMIGGLFGLMSINTMATIAIDRYYAIARPFHVQKFMTKKRAWVMILIVWIWSLASSLPPIFGWGRYILEGFLTSCTFDYLTRTANNRSYICFLYIFGFAIPLAIIIGCYSLIVKAVIEHENEMKKTAKKLNAEMRSKQDKKRIEIKVAKISVFILILYLISWLPYATVALIGQFGNAMIVTPFLSEIPVMFGKASAMHTPIVYALSHTKFKTAVHKRFPFFCCCKPANNVMTNVSSTRKMSTQRFIYSSVIGLDEANVNKQCSEVSQTIHTNLDLVQKEPDSASNGETLVLTPDDLSTCTAVTTSSEYSDQGKALRGNVETTADSDVDDND